MKKMRFEPINYQMIIENTFAQYLTDQAKEGWIFYKIYGEHIGFIKDESKDIKYQLEYGETDYDYDDFLEDCGYVYAGHFKRIIIYRNDNIHAPDLHSDDYIRLQATKDMVSKHPIIQFIVLMLLCLPLILIISFIPDMITSLGALFKLFEVILFVIVIAGLPLEIILITIQSLLVKKICQDKMNHKEVNYRWLNYVNNVLKVMSSLFLIIYPVMILCMIYIVASNFVYHLARILIVLLSVLVMMGVAKIFKKYRIEKKAIWLVYIPVILILSFAYEGLDILKEEEVIIPQKNAYMQEEAIYNENNGLWYDYFSYSYNPDQLWNPIKFERFETCFNEFVAKEVMKADVIEFEKETRASNEFIEAYLEEYGYYSSTDTKPKSYKEAIASLKQYNHDLVDVCYYNNHFMIARKGREILVSYIQDEENYINHIIDFYF